MRTNILFFASIAAILFFASCSKEEPSPEIVPVTTRAISVTATIPGDDPTTKVALTQSGKNINLTWEEGDQIQLAFVQGATKVKQIVTVKNITDGGTKAQFDIILPKGIINTETFDLYGVYGGGGLSGVNPTQAILPASTGNATSLNGATESVKSRNDAMLYFASKSISAANPPASVTFTHLGSLFSITVKNTGTTALISLAEARLVGVTGESQWAYNTGTGGKIYDLVSGLFSDQTSAGNYISFKAATSSLSAGATTTFWGWSPPLPSSSKVWPELKLVLRSAAADLYTTVNTKPARTALTTPVAGKSLYFYATWTGTQLVFTDVLHTVVATDLFFSEYIDGSSSNKYLEIYNGTGAQIDLANYQVNVYTNNTASPTNTYNLSGLLPNGQVVVIANASAAKYKGTINFSSSVATGYNGNDAVALRKKIPPSTTYNYVDIIGRIGNLPTTAWTSTGGFSTKEKTLVRKSSVRGGIKINPTVTVTQKADGFTTLGTEWDLYSIDDVTHLGSHTMN